MSDAKPASRWRHDADLRRQVIAASAALARPWPEATGRDRCTTETANERRERLKQVHPERRPGHLRLRLGRAEVPRTEQMEAPLHRAEALLDLLAQRGDGAVHLGLQRVHWMAPAALELGQVTNALGLDVLLDQRVHDAGQLG